MGKNYSNNGGTSFMYFLGVIGAAIYFVGSTSGFMAGLIGFLKALIWPAFLVYELLKFLYEYAPAA
ncbi:MAG: hypothetical protein HKO56_01780 [Bacteroidia bacterium]|nr:hypothetical protein [Bacteroidia bacterium]NNC86298.1 hypothetical protein [Bacteroidia bacterium]NNM15360.1 hypothetical protein [Bacteroidia bacterium]